MKFELKMMVGASIPQSAVNEVNHAMDILQAKQLPSEVKVAVGVLQHHLFDIVPEHLDSLSDD